MENPFAIGTFEYAWYASWMPVAAAIFAISMGVLPQREMLTA